MKDNKILLGQKIKEIRKKYKYTQEAFSELIGIETSSLSNIETGKSYPSMLTVLNIIDKLRIKPQELFDFEYFQSSQNLEDEMIEIIKKLSQTKKQILYRIVKSFDL